MLLLCYTDHDRKTQVQGFEELLEECRALVKGGVKEILVVAQDLTYYGIDLYGKIGWQN